MLGISNPDGIRFFIVLLIKTSIVGRLLLSPKKLRQNIKFLISNLAYRQAGVKSISKFKIKKKQIIKLF